MSEPPPVIRIPVDRSRAFARSLWRFVPGVLIVLGLCFWDIDWRLTWQSQKAGFLAFATVYSAAAAVALILLTTGMRLFLLAVWPGRTEIQIGETRIRMNLGPFGRHELNWAGVRIDIQEQLDPEFAATVAGDPVVPQLRHPDYADELASTIRRFGGLEHERLAAILEPYVNARQPDSPVRPRC